MEGICERLKIEECFELARLSRFKCIGFILEKESQHAIWGYFFNRIEIKTDDTKSNNYSYIQKFGHPWANYTFLFEVKRSEYNLCSKWTLKN